MEYNDIRKSWARIYSALSKTEEGTEILRQVKQNSKNKNLFMYAYVKKYYDFLRRDLKIKGDFNKISDTIESRGFRKRRYYMMTLIKFMEEQNVNN